MRNHGSIYEGCYVTLRKITTEDEKTQLKLGTEVFHVDLIHSIHHISSIAGVDRRGHEP